MGGPLSADRVLSPQSSTHWPGSAVLITLLVTVLSFLVAARLVSMWVSR